MNKLKKILALSDDEAAKQLKTKTNRELYDLAASNGIELPKGLRKDELIHKILIQGRMNEQLDTIRNSMNRTRWDNQ